MKLLWRLKGKVVSHSESSGNVIKEYADLQIALDRLNDPADPVISIQEMRTKLEL